MESLQLHKQLCSADCFLFAFIICFIVSEEDSFFFVLSVRNVSPFILINFSFLYEKVKSRLNIFTDPFFFDGQGCMLSPLVKLLPH
jgi:hypothetical protein